MFDAVLMAVNRHCFVRCFAAKALTSPVNSYRSGVIDPVTGDDWIIAERQDEDVNIRLSEAAYISAIPDKKVRSTSETDIRGLQQDEIELLQLQSDNRRPNQSGTSGRIELFIK